MPTGHYVIDVAAFDRACARSGLSKQKDIAWAMGIAQSHISRVRRGLTAPGLAFVQATCKAFAVEAESCFTFVPHEEGLPEITPTPGVTPTPKRHRAQRLAYSAQRVIWHLDQCAAEGEADDLIRKGTRVDLLASDVRALAESVMAETGGPRAVMTEVTPPAPTAGCSCGWRGTIAESDAHPCPLMDAIDAEQGQGGALPPAGCSCGWKGETEDADTHPCPLEVVAQGERDGFYPPTGAGC